MKKILSYLLLSLIFVVLLLMVVSAGAQTTRIKLVQIEKSNTVNGTKANQLPLSNGVGDLRYAQYTEINPTPIGYTPALTGNPAANYAQFVKPANGDVWYIDNEGRGIRLYVAANAGDYDWLEIGNNQIPNSITDSIYKYKYASVGGRYVWPTAEMLVIDSVAQGMFIVAGDRKAKVALYDTNNQTWSTWEQGGGTTSLIMQSGGTFAIQTAGSGTPQAPGTPITDMLVINGDGSIQFPQYPNTRTDPGTPTKLWGPDATGRMKNYDVSLINNGVFTSGPVTGSGTSLLPVTLLNSGVTAGSYTNSNITVDNYGRVTAASNGSGGSIGGSIANGQIAVGSGTNTISGSSALTFASGLLTVTGNATISAPTLTGSSATPALDISQTWNTTGTVNGLNVNITNTASNSSSNLINLRVGGNSLFRVVQNGSVNLGYSSTGPQIFTVSSGIGNIDNNGSFLSFYNNNGLINSTTIGAVNFGGNNFSGTTGTQQGVNISHTFAAPAGSANFRPFSINYTLNNSGAQTGTATGIFLNATETNLNGQTNNLMDLSVGGSSRFKVTNAGSITTTGSISNPTSSFGDIGGIGLGYVAGNVLTLKNNGKIVFGSSGYNTPDISLSRSAANILLLDNYSGTGFFERLQFGGTTSSFPALQTANVTTGTCTFTGASSTITTTTMSPVLRAGDIVTFSTTGALPAELNSGQQYYIVGTPTATSFQVSTTFGGSAITMSGAGTPTTTVTRSNAVYFRNADNTASANIQAANITGADYRTTGSVFAIGNKPTVSYVAASGTAGTATCNYGGDSAFNLSFSPGNTPTSSDYIQITFANPYPSGMKPIVNLTYASTSVAAIYCNEGSKTNTGFRINFQSGPSGSGTIDVQIVGGR